MNVNEYCYHGALVIGSKSQTGRSIDEENSTNRYRSCLLVWSREQNQFIRRKTYVRHVIHIHVYWLGFNISQTSIRINAQDLLSIRVDNKEHTLSIALMQRLVLLQSSIPISTVSNSQSLWIVKGILVMDTLQRHEKYLFISLIRLNNKETEDSYAE